MGAGRTDAGVHALGQVATFESARALTPRAVRGALNAVLPADIRVLAARVVGPGLDARRSARLKRYGYLLTREAVPSPFWRRYAWHLPRLRDPSAMQAGLALLRGTHDFSAFRAAAGRDRRPVCTLRAVRVIERRSLVAVLVSADAFLHHMVRNIVGAAVEVGLGRRPPGWIGDVLAGRERTRAGPTAPAHGLFLLSVRYPEPLFPGGGRGRGEPADGTRGGVGWG